MIIIKRLFCTKYSSVRLPAARAAERQITGAVSG